MGPPGRQAKRPGVTAPTGAVASITNGIFRAAKGAATTAIIAGSAAAAAKSRRGRKGTDVSSAFVGVYSLDLMRQSTVVGNLRVGATVLAWHGMEGRGVCMG